MTDRIVHPMESYGHIANGLTFQSTGLDLGLQGMSLHGPSASVGGSIESHSVRRVHGREEAGDMVATKKSAEEPKNWRKGAVFQA